MTLIHPCRCLAGHGNPVQVSEVVYDQLSVCWHVPDYSSEIQVWESCWMTCASAEAPGGSGLVPGKQSRARAQLCRAGFRTEASGGSLGLCRLWADPRGNFSVSLTSFPKKPLKKRENESDRDRRNQRFWLAPPPSASDLVKQLKALTHLGSCIFHQDECISFMSHFRARLRAQWAVLSASGGNGIKQSWPGHHKGCSKT